MSLKGHSLLWTSGYVMDMKASNNRVNKKKATKVTLKTHRKDSRPSIHDEIKRAASNVSAVRPEEIKVHQHY